MRAIIRWASLSQSWDRALHVRDTQMLTTAGQVGPPTHQEFSHLLQVIQPASGRVEIWTQPTFLIAALYFSILKHYSHSGCPVSAYVLSILLLQKSHIQTHSISSLPQQLLEVSAYNYLRFPERDWLFRRVTLSVSSLQPSCRPWVDFWGFIQHFCDTRGLGLG